ncbi:MAG: hypothetical protein GY820_39720 [Gammaproteobacteria bacterium]|nr:hypothetical protein [Gammaproteobacteria bacterium]
MTFDLVYDCHDCCEVGRRDYERPAARGILDATNCLGSGVDVAPDNTMPLHCNVK